MVHVVTQRNRRFCWPQDLDSESTWPKRFRTYFCCQHSSLNSSYQNDIMVLLLQFASALLGSKKDMPLQHCKKYTSLMLFHDIIFCIILPYIDKTNWSNHWTQKLSVATVATGKRILEFDGASLLHVIRTFSSQTWSVSHDFWPFFCHVSLVDHETQGGNTGIPGPPNAFNVTQVFEDLKSLGDHQKFF